MFNIITTLKDTVKILGIDPGTARLGYALVEYNVQSNAKFIISCGTIQTDKRNSESRRLAEIRKDLNSYLEEHKPDIFSVEKLFFFKNLKTIIPVAQARGVILEVAASNNIPVFEYTPLQVKQIITGHGRAEKSLIATLIKKEFNLQEDIKSDDAVDAIALAVSFLRSDVGFLRGILPSNKAVERELDNRN